MNHDISYYLRLLRRGRYHKYHSRQEHGLLDTRATTPRKFLAKNYQGVCVHWLGTPHPVLLAETEDSENYLQAVQRYHMKTKKWHDIAYNFAVSQQGHIYECRGINVVGGAQYGFNKRYQSVLCLIGHKQERPSRAMKTTLRHLIGAIAYKFAEETPKKETRVIGHRELNPFVQAKYRSTCPGPHLIKWIERQKTWRT